MTVAISEEISTQGPEWPWPGVNMQFISKSGGNQYRGALYADYLNQEWQSFNIDAEQIGRGAQVRIGLERDHTIVGHALN